MMTVVHVSWQNQRLSARTQKSAFVYLLLQILLKVSRGTFTTVIIVTNICAALELKA